MPEISRFFGIVIQKFFDEHGPPHSHATYGGTEVTAEWVRIHQTDLLENWRRLRSKVLALPIPPLE